MIEYGDEILIDIGDGDIVASVMYIDEDEIEFTTDGGNTSRTVWLDDLVSLGKRSWWEGLTRGRPSH